MSRVLLGWEMGSNLGHVARLLPLARGLRMRGHTVLIAARDVTRVSAALGQDAIPFIQAPFALVTPRRRSHPSSFADLLAVQGWGESSTLSALIRAWRSLFRLFEPDAILLDYAPTAALASRLDSIPCVGVGTGFENPPLVSPLPPFPGFPGATVEGAAQTEEQVLNVANRVLGSLGVSGANCVAHLIRPTHTFLATFAELDHYGSRADADYVGSISDLDFEGSNQLDADPDRKVFAYLRSNTPSLRAILGALAKCGRRIVCYGPDLPASTVDAFVSPGFLFADRPVALAELFRETDLCVSYGSAGLVTRALLDGVPQLMSPAHVEAQLTAHRVELIGGGLVVRGEQTEKSIGRMINTLLSSHHFRDRAKAFALRYYDFNPARAVDKIIERLECLAA